MRTTFSCSRFLSVVGISFSLLVVAQAAEPAAAEREKSAIRATAAAYLEAVNRGDVDAIRSFWTADGNLVDESGRSTSISDLQPSDDPKPAVPNNPLKLNARTDSIRLITPTVAIEDGTSELDSATSGQATGGRYSVVWVRQDGKWLIDAVREAAIANPAAANQLSQLDWMIGQWAEEGETAAFSVSFQWSANKNFIVGEMRIQPRENDPHVITQRIGWDAAIGKLRSWNFDSEGGFSEGVWTAEGAAWSVATTGILPDGKRTRGRRVVQRIGENAVLLDSVEFQIDGEPVPDLRIKLTRQPVEAKSR
jgi:ketosteroid isomerase-like protein